MVGKATTAPAIGVSPPSLGYVGELPTDRAVASRLDRPTRVGRGGADGTDHAPVSRPTAENLASIPAELGLAPVGLVARGRQGRPEDQGQATQQKADQSPGLYGASTTDPATWGTFEWCVAALATALEEWERGSRRTAGSLGLVFTRHDPFVGLTSITRGRDHRDHCSLSASPCCSRSPAIPRLLPALQGCISLYKEPCPRTAAKKGSIEVYSGAFFTMTGWHLGRDPWHGGTPAVSALGAAHTAGLWGPTPPQPQVAVSPSPTLDDDTLLSKARSLRNSAKFIRLWAGDTLYAWG